MTDGITCPDCGHASRKVLESRRLPDRVRRRCICSTCDARFTTWELRADQISAVINQAAADRAGRLLSRFQAVEQAMGALRELLDTELKAEPAAGQELAIVDLQSTLTCEQCNHWDGRCDLGFPDPQDEGIEFARWCSSYQKVVA